MVFLVRINGFYDIRDGHPKNARFLGGGKLKNA